MKNPYDSYLMRKPKPKFLGFYCGRPVYEGDNVNLKRLQQMSLRMAARVNLVDDGGLSEKVQEANDLMARRESQLKANEILNGMVVTSGESDESFSLKIVLALMFVFFVLLVTL